MSPLAGGGADDTEAPLLPSPAAGRVPSSGGAAPRRNWFAFLCAALASMTTMLHGYSTFFSQFSRPVLRPPAAALLRAPCHPWRFEV